MVFSHKTAKFAPVWTIILKIRAVFVHQSLTEHALTLSHGVIFMLHWRLRYTRNGKQVDAAIDAVLV